ncbi:hypothetical protein DFH08DRAFT_1089153 [Mycena albidolilacea]|uniref:Uncharacterized protein n=1 Tax=Mycena albidolilacea TaxID=1033008 RepID=A0AAD6Z2M5_9AGAR|nr:hypothetical protein DFH08DRAFT_1089153 [Mycena albidolilacea]
MVWPHVLRGMPIRDLWAPPQLGRPPTRVAMYFPTPSVAAVDLSIFHRPVPAPFADARNIPDSKLEPFAGFFPAVFLPDASIELGVERERAVSSASRALSKLTTTRESALFHGVGAKS